LHSFQARRVQAKVRIKDGGVCLAELAADLVHKGDRDALPSRSRSLPQDSVALILRDTVLNRQLHFRCSP
jgi:hypothetical protein